MPVALKRIGLRVLVSYWALYTMAMPFQAVRLSFIAQAMDDATNHITVWFGTHVLGITSPMPIQPTGSGDTIISYVWLAVQLLGAIVLGVMWWALDRKRDNDARVTQWSLVYLRYTLATVMFSYGLAKVFPSQFSPGLSPERLVETMGEYSPMGLLWTFMSFSPAYTIFAGLGETLGGALLCFKRTATLGGLVSAAVMTNVVALNYMYDVPVKLYSSHLLIAALVVAVPDMRRLANVLVFNRAAEQRPADPPLFGKPKVQLAMTVLLAAVMLFQVFMLGRGSYGNMKRFLALPTTMPFYGIYDVAEMRVNGKVLPPLVTDTVRWRRVVFGAFGRLHVRLMADTAPRLRYTDSASKKMMQIAGAPGFGAFRYARPDSTRIELHGRRGADSLDLVLVKSPKTYLLTSRGYNWVQELPFNR